MSSPHPPAKPIPFPGKALASCLPALVHAVPPLECPPLLSLSQPFPPDPLRPPYSPAFTPISLVPLLEILFQPLVTLVSYSCFKTLPRKPLLCGETSRPPPSLLPPGKSLSSPPSGNCVALIRSGHLVPLHPCPTTSSGPHGGGAHVLLLRSRRAGT